MKLVVIGVRCEMDYLRINLHRGGYLFDNFLLRYLFCIFKLCYYKTHCI